MYILHKCKNEIMRKYGKINNIFLILLGEYYIMYTDLNIHADIMIVIGES